MINKFKERRVDHINGIIRQVEDCNRRAKVHNYSTGNKMNDSEYQEIKRRWDNKHSEINKLIAYCEELREREIGWTMTLSSLEEENEKLNEELRIERIER